MQLNIDWVSAPKEANASGDWETNWEDAEWDDEDPDDSFQERLREEIKKVLERTRAAQKAK